MTLDLAMDSWICPKNTSSKRKNKFNVIKIKGGRASKDITKRVEHLLREWEKVRVNHICDNDLESRMHNELLQLNNTINNLKMPRGL